ncbi:uncharacterized protein LOC132759842 [Ruditapes philippinarum]|uniref:uncharacterized protein LOC132759842 n=1 Tax=Ruditapes philippinarum TaxID=129788 RepID=UPI00295BF40A|nr:uncharacterized protein LOC132759842 [Ruditapes philippinarum]
MDSTDDNTIINYRNQEKFTVKESFNYDALDKLGYSKSLCEKRIKMYEIISNCGTELIRRRKGESVNTVVAGSRAEGMCTSCDSDVDILFIHRNILCTNSGLNVSPDRDVFFIFQLDFDDVPSGYAKLRLQKFDEYRRNLQLRVNLNLAFVQRNVHIYLRNDMLISTFFDHFQRQGWVKQQSVFDEITGPARTITVEMPTMPELNISADCVLGIKCNCPSLLDDWYQMERKHSWPSKDLVEAVRKLNVLVVPAGCKGSADEELQWRMSFTLAEQALVHSFNDVQIKLYAALKMIANHDLKPICDSITSYILKNLLFVWFENNEVAQVTKDRFDATLIQLLVQLKKCITWRHLPCYMIPSKNLLQNKIFEIKRVQLIRRLDHVISDRDNVLLRCPKVKLMKELSEKEFEEMVAFRELFEQEFTARFWVSANCPRLTGKIWDYNQKPEHVFKIIVDQVFPIIRAYNPMSLFDRIISTSKEEFYNCLVNGIQRGYHKS